MRSRWVRGITGAAAALGLVLTTNLGAAGDCCGASAGDARRCPMHVKGGMRGAQQQDMQTLHRLLNDHDKIRRQVMNLPNGIHTVTRSDDAAIVQALTTHVAAMTKRLHEGQPIHARDPLFAEIFRNAHHIKVSVAPLPDGVHVIETSDDPYTVTLLQEHAGVVNLFVERGMSEMHQDHAVPKRP